MHDQHEREQTLEEDDSEEDQNSLNDSLEDNRIGSTNKLIDIKDDKHIVNSAA